MTMRSHGSETVRLDTLAAHWSSTFDVAEHAVRVASSAEDVLQASALQQCSYSPCLRATRTSRCEHAVDEGRIVLIRLQVVALRHSPLDEEGGDIRVLALRTHARLDEQPCRLQRTNELAELAAEVHGLFEPA